jgi:GNAT superfamily N-acetyltransferase
MVLRIMLADPADAALVRGITLEAFAEHRKVLRPPSGSHAETVAEVETAIASGGAVLAWEDGMAVGTARFERGRGHLYVRRVAVLPAHRGRGIASEIMHYLEDVAVAEGFQRVQVGVRMSLPRNVSLYERLGYKLIDVSPHPKGPDMVGTMIKDLT